jgi:hypothetical protein
LKRRRELDEDWVQRKPASHWSLLGIGLSGWRPMVLRTRCRRIDENPDVTCDSGFSSSRIGPGFWDDSVMPLRV